MRKRDAQLEQLFLMGLSIARAACAATPPTTEGPRDAPLGSASASASAAVRSPPPVDPVRDDKTAAGYALGYRSAPPLEAALSGLELLGFADVVDGKLVCEGERPCPSAWDALLDGQLRRAAVVKKRSTLAAITTTNFFQWVGPVDGPERASLRASVEPGRRTTTCKKLEELGYACAPGSEPNGIPVRSVEKGFEVATFDAQNVCDDDGGYGNAISLGAVVVDREGNTSNTETVLTRATDAKARETVHCQYAVQGRRTEGDGGDAPREGDSTIDHFVRVAREEAAAVVAFERLAAELTAHGAPPDLTSAARRAADDERRHAATFRAEAARSFPAGGPGAPPRTSTRPRFAPAPPIEHTRARPLLAVLLENAREGCANETYAAVVATHQGFNAPAGRLRRAFRRVARDEQRHAALSYRIHAWGRSVVSEPDRRALDAALEDAVSAFAANGASTPAGRALGEPDPTVARSAFTHVAAALLRAHVKRTAGATHAASTRAS